jgi:GTP-binding protein
MNAQTEMAVLDAALVVFVVDGLVGLNHEDVKYAKWLRKLGRPVVLLINKAENLTRNSPSVNEFHRLGFTDSILVSAAHNHGFATLLEYIYHNAIGDTELKDPTNPDIRLAIVGRPNVGKSTIINSLLGENRVIVGDMAGITRDSIAIDYQYKDTKFKIFDTAGMRKRKNIQENLEKLSVYETKGAINFANICALVIDASQPLEKQDLSVADEILSEGRGLILVVNKVDKIEKMQEFTKHLNDFTQRKISDAKDIPIIYCCATSGKNIHKILEEASRVFISWSRKIATSRLNNWLREVEQRQPVPLNSQNKRPRLKFMAQVKTRPPYFIIYSNYPDDIPKTYVRYLGGKLKEEFNFMGTQVRIHFRKSDNPFDQGKK